jgi:hypothetical protein
VTKKNNETRITELERKIGDMEMVLKEAAKHESPWQIVKNWFSEK